MSSPLILTSRSHAECDWLCHRKFYLNYHLNGTGVVPESEAYELAFGTAIHSALASIASQHPNVDIDAIAAATAYHIDSYLSKTDKSDEYRMEQITLVEGLIRGFHLHLWPRLIQQYPKILAIEQEMSYDYNGMIFMAKPDLIVAAEDGSIVYLEWKTTSSRKDEWISSWNSAIQLHATARAIEASLGEPVASIQVCGIYKGFYSYGKMNSPFVYAYQRNAQPPFSQGDISYTYKAGYKKAPVWELAGGVKAWVEGMPSELLSEQYPTCPPIFVRNDLVESFFKQRFIREHEIQMALELLKDAPEDSDIREAILDTSFSQNFSACQPGWGHPCPFNIICHSGISDIQKAGFRPRSSHHPLEAEVLNA